MAYAEAPLNGTGPQEVWVYLDYVSYNQAGNYSTWYWEIWYEQNGGIQWASDATHWWSLSGFAVTGANYFGIPSSWAGGGRYKLGGGYFNKYHDANGYLASGVMTGTINTSVSNIGDGSAGVSSGGVPRIPKVPDAPLAPVFVSAEPDSLSFTIASPADNGGYAVTTYEMQVLDEVSGPDDVVGSYQSGASLQTTPASILLEPSTKYRVRYRAKNALGWSGWGPTTMMETEAGVYVSDGTNWVPSSMKVSTGTAWVAMGPTISDGDSWEDPLNV